MTPSRPVLLLLIGTALIGAVFLASRITSQNAGSGSTSADKHPAAADKQPGSTPKQPAAAGEQAGSADKPGKEPPRGRPHGGGAGPAAPRTNGPKVVARALDRRRKVVLFFFQPGGLDDAATSAAVGALERRRGAVVVSDRVGSVDRYQEVLGSVAVNQAPSIVVIGADRRARLIEGFIDGESLAQEVADTR